jgi:4'-phosphopantetheinyl transferase
MNTNYDPEKTLLSNTVAVWQYNIQQLDLSTVAALKQYLSRSEAARADRFIHQDDVYRLTVAYGGLRILLSGYLSLSPDTFILKTHQHGKPYLDNQEIYFNISHSNHWVMWAFAWDHPVGIDVEYEREKVEVLELAKRFFSAQEYQALKQIANGHQRTAFYQCWTRKEAFIKGVGKGLFYPLKEFSVPLDPHLNGHNILHKDRDTAPWYLYSLNMPKKYQAALAVNHQVKKIEINTLRI